MRKRRWIKWTLLSSAGIIVLWLVGDLGYSFFVRRKIAQWENDMQWGGSDVLVGCESFTVGEGGDGVLLVHGINDSPRIWRKMAPRIADAGYTCIAIRLPGFAERVAEYGKYDSDAWRESVAQQLRKLAAQHDRVFVVAHSLGGAITLATLTDHSELADGVVLIAPAIEVSDARSPVLSTRTWHRIGNVLLFTRTTLSPYDLDVHDPSEREDPLRCPFAPRRVIDETFKLIDLNQQRIDRWKLPTLMVLSADDQVVNSTAAEAYFRRLTGQGNRLIWTEDSGHTIPVDYDWEEVTDATVAFFRDIAEQD